MRRLALLLLFASCVEDRAFPGAGGVTSLALELISPADVGSTMNPVLSQRATFNLTALDEKNQQFPGDVAVDVYVSFGGVKTGAVGSCGAKSGGLPVASLTLPGGRLENQTIDLPQAFGPTTIWLDDPQFHSTGASPTIYFRNPFIADIQTPPDPMAANATFCTAFERKFIIVDKATGSGKLVVSSVFGNAFAVTDTGATRFNSIYIFSFGKPPTYIVPGRVLEQFSGNISKFLGFTEVNFPLFAAKDEIVAEPPATPLSYELMRLRDNVGLLAYSASTVSFTGKICDPDPPNPTGDPDIQRIKDNWRRFSSFVLDNDTTCSNFSNFAVELPSKILGNFNPLEHRGEIITVRGMLKNNSGQNSVTDANGMTVQCSASVPCATGTCVEGECKRGAFNFWTIVPRSPADVPQ